MQSEGELRLKITEIDKETDKRIQNLTERINSINFFTPVRTIEEANSLAYTVDDKIGTYIKYIEHWAEKTGEGLRFVDKKTLIKGQVERSEKLIEENGRWGKRNIAMRAMNSIISSKAQLHGIIPHYTMRACDYLHKAMTVEVVKDLIPLGYNPFEPVIELYSMGLSPTCFRSVNGKEKFVVDFPLKSEDDKKEVFGCYAHGDREILWMHGRVYDCSNLQPTKISRIIE